MDPGDTIALHIDTRGVNSYVPFVEWSYDSLAEDSFFAQQPQGASWVGGSWSQEVSE